MQILSNKEFCIDYGTLKRQLKLIWQQ